MDELIKAFPFTSITYLDDILYVDGPIDKNMGFTTFLSAYRSPLWNEIPETTKVVFKNVMVETRDDKYGGDKWCARWLISYFGDNISFVNCYYADFHRTIDRQYFTTTREVLTTDVF